MADEKGMDPRGALMAMFNRRGAGNNGSDDNSPPPTAQNSEVSTPDKDNYNDEGEDDENDEQQPHSDDPKIALSVMLARGGGSNGKTSTPGDDNDHADNDTEDPDPRNALSAMFAKRGEVAGGSRAGSKIQLLSPSKVKQSSSMEREEEEEKKEIMDPRASLMAMLNKRGAPQSSIDDSSTQHQQSNISANGKISSSSREEENEKETVDPRASLMAMLNKRGVPQSSINDSSTQQQQSNIAANGKISSSSREEENEKETVDPRASLMAMLNKRGAPQSSSSSEQQQNSNAESGNMSSSEREEEETVNPRTSLMAMLNKRGGGGASASHNLHNHATNNHDRENNNRKDTPQKQQSSEPSSVGVGKPALKNDPKYEKYFKMIKVGMPLPVVQHAMTRDGFDASVMDGDHNMTEDGLEPITAIVNNTCSNNNNNTIQIPVSSLPNNSLDDGIVVFDRDGLSGHGLLTMEDDGPTDLPLVNGSGIRVQRGNTYYTNEMCKCGIRESSAPCQTVIRPYPHNEFTIILEGSVTIINDSFTEMTFRAGDAFIIPKGAYVSWKHIMTVRRLYVIIIDGEGEVSPLEESLSVRRVEYPLMNKRFIPQVVYSNPNGQFMVGLTNMIEFTNVYELCQDDDNNKKLLGSCRHLRSKVICNDTTEKGGRLIVSYPFPRNELLHIVTGEVKINTRTFVVGDTFLVPRGTICQWDSTGVVRVIFCSWHSTVRQKDTICKAISSDVVSQVPMPPNAVDSSNAGAGRPALKDDPKYTKYFKMLKIGMPIDVVKHAMTRDGFDPTIMDADHNVPLKS